MTESLKFLFQYLRKTNIHFDQNEFAYQIQSHPDFPSLLSIVDTLNFFNICNKAVRVPISDLDVLPNHFMALLKEDGKQPQLYYIEKKGIDYYYFNEKKMITISKESLKSRWNEIVLLAEKSEIEGLKIKNKTSYVLPITCLTVFLIVLSKFEIQSTLFFILPFMGLFFSIIVLKDLFGVKSELANKFCNFTKATSCNDVIGSEKWKVFKLINFSDLSIFLFASQFFGLFVFLLFDNVEDFFSIQRIMLLAAIPIVFVSLYYQKFVEQKWCPVCLLIVTIVFLELSYILFATSFSLNISFISINLFGLIFLCISLIWSVLKSLLTSQKQLKEFRFKANRFIRNYENFKKALISEMKFEFPEIPLVLGNKDGNVIITLISSPFCGHCKETQKFLEEILRKYPQNLKLQIILKTNFKQENDENRKILTSLYEIYNQDKENFRLALRDWYNKTNLKNWLNKYYINVNDKYDEILKVHNNWSTLNEINYTPAIFVNGYEYPKNYERENLEYFINELIEDELWHNDY